MANAVFKGSGVAIVTPFTKDGVNIKAYCELIEFQLAEGTDAIIACGTTGEPSTMSADEKRQTIRRAVEVVNGRVPVIAGTGGNDTKKVIADSLAAKELGADALLIVTPYYNKATQGGMVEHYNMITREVGLPVIIYNVPARTGLNMLPNTLFELSKNPLIAGMKEASANIEQITEMARLCPDLPLYSGNDDHILPLLSLGGLGVISVLANVAPRDTHELVMAFLNGDIAKSRQLQFKVNPLVKQLFSEVNPIPVKTALELMGYDVGPLRMPLTPMTEGNKAKLVACMKEYGLI